MTRLLSALRIHLNHTRLAHWLECLQGNHDKYRHFDGDQHVWIKCKWCPWMMEDNRILMRGPVPVRRGA